MRIVLITRWDDIVARRTGTGGAGLWEAGWVIGEASSGRTAPRAESGAKPERVTSAELLRNKPELIIVHDGREYRLRITQNGKLILTA
jgi:hemin uptake protein HemP